MIGDVIYEQKCVGAQIRRSPKATIFFLAGGISEREEVGFPIDGACDRIRVLWKKKVRKR